MPDEIESAVREAQIHDGNEKSEYDLVLELDACSLRKKEEQGQQKSDDDAAVYIGHTVSDIRICRYHEPSQKVEKIVLERIINLKLVACGRAVLKDQICRNSECS